MTTKETPLAEEHRRLNALMSPFAGWEMPIHYGSILEEAKHTRLAVSIFDICHMGEFFVIEDPACSSLDKIITVPVIKMKEKSCRYGFLLNDDGTVIDDLIVYRTSQDRWMVVVNAANEISDFAAIQSGLSAGADIENRSGMTAKIDVQGPGSREVMKSLAGGGIAGLAYYTFGNFNIMGSPAIISRTGYTGELGYEVYIDSGQALPLWRALLEKEGVRPAGLGARDILRLEMGYPLYGDELTEETTPVEAGLSRFLDFDKDFTGRESLMKQMDAGPARSLVGIMADGRRTPRHENRIIFDGRDAGHVTSGVFSPHCNRGIAMGYMDSGLAKPGREITIDAGKGTMGALIQKPPFISDTSLHKQEA